MTEKFLLNKEVLARAQPTIHAELTKPLAVTMEQKALYLDSILGLLKGDFLSHEGTEIQIALTQLVMHEGVEHELPASLQMLDNGVAVLPFVGQVLSNAPRWAEYYGYVSPERFASDLRMAVDSEAVTEIIPFFDSYGGTVAGTREAFHAMEYARESDKLKHAYGANAASAGYWALSPAPEITVSPTGIFASIGVLSGTYDDVKMWEERGIEWSWVRSGNKKALGNIGEEITEEVIEGMQQKVDDLFAVFWGDVNKYRPLPQELDSGESYVGTRAQENNLADSMGSFNDLVNERIEANQNQNSTRGFFSMNLQEYAAAHPEEYAAGIRAIEDAAHSRGVTQGQAIAETATQNAETDTRISELEATVRDLTAQNQAHENANAEREQAEAQARLEQQVSDYFSENVPESMYVNLEASEARDRAALTVLAVESGFEAAKAKMDVDFADYKVRFAALEKATKEDPDALTEVDFSAITTSDDGNPQVQTSGTAFSAFVGGR